MAIKNINFTTNNGREYYRDKDKGLYLYNTKNGFKSFYIKKMLMAKMTK